MQQLQSSIEIWAAVTINGTGALRKSNKIRKMVDYIQILKENLMYFGRLGHGHKWVFQQDNEPQKGGKGVHFEITFPQSNLF